MVLSEKDKSAWGTAVRVARRMLHADQGLVVLFDADGHRLAVQDPEHESPSIPEDVLDGMRQVGTLQLCTAEESFAASPLRHEDEVVGALVFRKADPAGFSTSELEDIESVASHLATLDLEPAELLQRETIEDAFGLDDPTSIVWGDSEAFATEVLSEAPGQQPVLAFGNFRTTPFMSSEGLEEMLANTVSKLLETTEAHVAALVLADDSEPFSLLALAATPNAPDVNSSRLISRTVVGRVLESGLPLLTLDAGEDDFVTAASKSVARLSVTTIMCVPLQDGSVTVGALYCATFSFSGKFDHGTLMALMNDAQTVTTLLKSLGQLG